MHRLLVRDGNQVLGVLGQLDLVSFVANHSHIVAQQIDHAASSGRPGAMPPSRIDEMVALLHGSGIRIERITRLVTELNRRLFAHLWALVAPAELVANSCLLVMGSEGRGEQILKTDQDNALLRARRLRQCSRAGRRGHALQCCAGRVSATRRARAASC